MATETRTKLHRLFHQADAWFQLGQTHEAAGDRLKAAQCYYLATDLERHPGALDALRRLGYLHLDASPSTHHGDDHGF